MSDPLLQPPRLARRLLTRTLPIDVREHITAELDEVYQRRCAQAGIPGARLWYWREVMSFAGRFTVEENRRGRMRGWLEGWSSDLVQAARRLTRVPGFTVISVMTLAIAIGVSTAIFSVVDAVLINPLPHPNAERLVSIAGSAPGSDLPPIFGAAPEFFVAYRDDADKLESLGMYQMMQSTARTDDHVDRLFMAAASSDVFTTLGATPFLGRLPNKEDDDKKAPVMVISHSLWTSWFNSDPGVVGKMFEAAGTQRTVIGVMKPEFRFPEARTSIWVRASIADESNITPGRFGMSLVGRMKPGTTTEALSAQLATIAKRLPERFGGTPAYARIIGQHQPVVRSLEEQLVGDAARPLWILLGTVAIVFLIACANVANLFIVRGESRRRDLAVRQALGAGRGSLIRTMMSEALLLASAGGVTGALIAAAGVPLIVRAAPEGIPNLDLVSLNAMALLFAVGLTIAAAGMFGLIPAIRFSRPSRPGELQQAGRGGVGSARGRIARNALVVVQTGCALVLLVAAGLLARSFWQLTRVQLGYDTAHIFSFQVAPSGRDLTDGPSVARFHHGLIDRIAAMPGVESVGVVNELPLDEGSGRARFATERTLAAAADAPLMPVTHTGGDYFKAMGIGLVAGRLFDSGEQSAGSANALLTQAAADVLFPGENPLGKRFLRGTDPATGIWLTVVGVVGNVRLDSYRQAKPDALIYLPMVGPAPGAWRVGSPAYVVKTTRADQIAPDIRTLLREYAPGAPMYRIFTMDGLAKRSIAQLSFTMLMIAIAAVLAMVLGAVGVYGVLSYVVSQRKREIALRMALGAEVRAVRRMVVIQGGKVTLIGVVLGVCAALALTSVLESLLFGVKALDAATFVAMSALMLGVAFLASYLPARRASSVDPIDALRGD
ncbi:MAG: ABC transporter permease [Acidobacteriota bacterium]|nr:ABC transporter permease [Acidobacteriota bacterium]